jgi:hypothetical protein
MKPARKLVTGPAAAAGNVRRCPVVFRSVRLTRKRQNEAIAIGKSLKPQTSCSNSSCTSIGFIEKTADDARTARSGQAGTTRAA